MNLQENINRIKQMMGVINEDNSRKDLSLLIKQSLEPMMERENNIICDIEITAPWNRESYYNVSYKVELLVIGGPNSKYWPVTQAVRKKYDKIIDEVWDTIYSYFGQAVDVDLKTTNQCNKESKEEESEGVGAYAAPAFEMKPDHVHFKHQYNEEMKEGEITERCWKGYTQKGMKTMFGKRYPNCVKKTK